MHGELRVRVYSDGFEKVIHEEKQKIEGSEALRIAFGGFNGSTYNFESWVTDGVPTNEVNDLHKLLDVPKQAAFSVEPGQLRFPNGPIWVGAAAELSCTTGPVGSIPGAPAGLCGGYTSREVFKVLKQVHPDKTLGKGGFALMNLLLTDFTERVFAVAKDQKLDPDRPEGGALVGGDIQGEWRAVERVAAEATQPTHAPSSALLTIAESPPRLQMR